MKKRIGTKLYDTESSELIADVGIGTLYRKRTRGREWFLLIGDDIDPVDDKQARALLGENVRVEKPKPWTTIWVDRETHTKIAEMAKRDHMTITEEVKRVFKSL